MVKRIATAEARASLKELVGNVQDSGDRVKITRYGKTAAWLVAPKDGEVLEECAAELDDCQQKRVREAVAAKKASPKRRRAG
jgi:PHD/YefM family antitoxin component YafN of YafNO toxin-antitoxin module